MPNINVTKRDGTTEQFLPWKIQRVAMAAGLTAEQSYKLVGRIMKWIQKQNTGTVNSVEISNEVLRHLKDIDPYAANMFQWYQDTKK